MPFTRFLGLALIFVFPLGLRAQGDLEFFESKIRPVLAEHCYSCHSQKAKKVKGKLFLDSQEMALKGGETGPAVVPGSIEKSLLLDAISYKNVDLLMPPKGKLSDAAIADLTTWIKKGAYWPKEATTTKIDKRNAFDVAQRKQEHWSWQPIRSTPPPETKANSTAIDRFLRQKLSEKGLEPAPPAEPRVILRRLTFDLIGLPPTPAEVSDFEKACHGTSTTAAVEAVVDRLLASPRFGERWARHWLDLVRYAESRGHEFDFNVPNAFQYRDYVIRAINADVPYDQFVREHIAGDLMTKPRLHPTEGINESMLGTGFWFLGEQVHSPVDICQDRADRVDNMIDVMSKSFLGMTVACARCHDHKFDAISTKDYYALAGFLESSSYRLVPLDTFEHNRKVAGQLWKLRDEHQAVVGRLLAAQMHRKLDGIAHELAAASESFSENVAVVAERHRLDANRVRQWKAHLEHAAKNANDPLHLYAQRGKSGKETPPLPQESTPGPWEGRVIVDYAKAGTNAWLPDGFAFGPRPAAVGSLVFGDAKRPVRRVVTESAAEFDPAWSAVKITPGAENEPGALGRVVRAGRTLRTPKFEIGSGRIHVRMRGSALAYAAVEGHVMILGPLHGALVRDLVSGPAFRWQTFDLSSYKGRRVHFEFTPTGDDFALAQVVEGASAPEVDGPAAARWLKMQRDLAVRADAPERWPALLQDQLQNACLTIGFDGGSATPEQRRLANWLVQNQSLIGVPAFTDDRVVRFINRQTELLASIRLTSRLAPAILDGNPVDERVFIRGNYKTPGEVAPRRLLEALVGPATLKSEHGSGRMELARQITDPAITPLFSRVAVNRVWHHLFGRGLVASVDNFGVLGETPSHPELLDYLADQFVKDRYSIKKLIRDLVTTRAYQRSTAPSGDASKFDPGNVLLQHARVRRLEGEVIRDAILHVSGRLDTTPFGPSVPVHLTDFQQGRGRPGSGPLDGNGRRSIYLSVRRNFLSSLLLAFDTPIPFSTVGRRTVSNVPAQALILLNDPFVHQQSALWARRTLNGPGDVDQRVRTMYLQAYGRGPSPEEAADCRSFVAANDEAAWTSLAHVLMNAKEFVFLE